MSQNQKDNKSLEPQRTYYPFVDTVLAVSHQHLFGPTLEPVLPPKHEAFSFQVLVEKLPYLKPHEHRLVSLAFEYAKQVHSNQYRQSGEPYITHPLIVAEICASWKLDAQSIAAALLHDVIEDHAVPRHELIEKFGPKVAELVDGLTKLDRLEFSSVEEAQAENFRKMLLAMSRDVRVILVKLADRLHNMRTLSYMPLVKKRRVAQETLEIFAPIANRLGLNATFRELQDLSFRHIYPLRYKVLKKAWSSACLSRQEAITKILHNLDLAFAQANINVQIATREKSLYSIYRKMYSEHLLFTQVLDIYSFRIVVSSLQECYAAVGVLHALYKPIPGQFKDYIAIPKTNGYQSLHTTLIGFAGMPIEFQICTQLMCEIAEVGVAAHWLYKDDKIEHQDIQTQTYRYFQSLLDIQSQSWNSNEFLEHVKTDLFPDSVYVFTPKSQIYALPAGSTALDFAYAVHSDLGNHCIAIKVNNELSPLRTPLKNGDVIEVMTASHSQPNPAWLNFLRSGRARSALRYYLKSMKKQESIAFGKQLLMQALNALNIKNLDEKVWQTLLNWCAVKTYEELYMALASGEKLAIVLAKRVELLLGHDFLPSEAKAPSVQPIFISGSEGMSVTFSRCCHPIPEDEIIAYVKENLEIHQRQCPIALKMQHQHPQRCIDVAWAQNLSGKTFHVALQILVKDRKGSLAKIAQNIKNSNINIAHITMESEHEEQMTTLKFILQVKNRRHLAHLIRLLRKNPDCIKINRKL